MKDSYNSEKNDISTGKTADSLSLLKATYYKYGNKIINYVNTVVNDEDVSASIVNDCFVEVFNDKKTLPPKEKIEVYLFTRAKWKALNYLARKKEVVVDVDLNQLDIAQVGYEEKIIREEMIKSATEAIAELSISQRKVIKLMIQGASIRETAEEMGIQEVTVRNLKLKAIKKLRKILMPRWDFT